MRELLVIADKDAGKQLAFHHALELAKSTGAGIEFVGFVYASGVDSSDLLTHEEKRKVHHKYIDRKTDVMEKFLEGVDLEGVKVKTDVVWEKSLENWVVARCDQKSFDLVFKSGNRSESFMYTPSDWTLIRECPEPIMIVCDENPWKEGGRLLAALDLSSDSKRSLALNEEILRQSIKLAKASNSEVHACYSMTIPKVAADLELIDPKAYEAKMKESVDPIIHRLSEEAGLDMSKVHLVSGKPAREILRIANKVDADAIVMGNKSKISLRGRLLGTTAEAVLHKSRADVVVVK